MSADIASQVTGRLGAGVRPLLLLLGVAAAVAAGVSIVLWSQGPSMSLLYTNLDSDDLVAVTRSLEAAGIEHRADAAAGSVSVETSRLNDARLSLAAQGMPQSDGGFAAIARDSGFGVSQFMEGARYQHALETELARTISSLQSIAGARVHIASPRQSVFVRERRPATASVFVQLKPGRRLESEQVTAIVNLVASSIPELEAGDVTVVDQSGRLLSAREQTGDAALQEKQFEFARRLETDYTQRIEALLAPLIGEGRVRAQVVAQVDMSVTEEAREQYRPESQVVRSEQLSEETARQGGGPQGVPGSLSNQPPDGGVARPAGAPASLAAAGAGNGAMPPAAAPENTSRQSTRNFEIDRTLAYTRQPAGRLRRLTVAVLVDDVKGAPLAADQLARITTLVKDAVGFDAGRGDSVNVVNASFIAEHAEPIEEEKIPLWQAPWVRELAKILAGAGIVIVLLLAVVRPLIRGLLASGVRLPPATGILPAAARPDGGALMEEASRAVPQATAIAYEQQVAQARSLVAQDPKRVARVVKTWVGKDE
ncbi:MAG: hypothetical protein CMLOHMNK_00680 [Steroidobacteraceae bacterium]|nr:hypothetical protein [Steroidobacteraceae bacterium]